MDVRPLFAWIALLGVLAGCRQDPRVNAHIELLNAEKRKLEDHVYELEYEYEQAQEELQEIQRENERLRERLAGGSGRWDEGSREEEPSGDIDLSPPVIELPTDSAPPEDLELKPPDVDPGVPGEPTIELPRSGASEGERETLSVLDLSDPEITHIAVDDRLTGGINLDRRPGDDGLVVVFQPRNGKENYVPLAGPVSVVLLDGAEQGEQKRVARWDLSASEVAEQMARHPESAGIHLQLPWPDRAPRHGRLHLFVRYTTADGQQLESDTAVTIDTRGQLTDHWAPRPNNPQPQPTTDDSIELARPQWKPYR